MKCNTLFAFIGLTVGIIILPTLIFGSHYKLNMAHTNFLPMAMGDKNGDTISDETYPQSIKPKGTANPQISSLNETHTSNASNEDHNKTSIPIRSIISDEELAKLKERIKNGNTDR